MTGIWRRVRNISEIPQRHHFKINQGSRKGFHHYAFNNICNIGNHKRQLIQVLRTTIVGWRCDAAKGNCLIWFCNEAKNRLKSRDPAIIWESQHENQNAHRVPQQKKEWKMSQSGSVLFELSKVANTQVSSEYRATRRMCSYSVQIKRRVWPLGR